MKIVNNFGEQREAKQVQVKMVKTILVNVYFEDLDLALLHAPEVHTEELEQIAHEDWLEAWGAILNLVSKRFPYIDVELFSTDNVKMEIVE